MDLKGPILIVSFVETFDGRASRRMVQASGRFISSGDFK
jgi:hypothetical protein